MMLFAMILFPSLETDCAKYRCAEYRITQKHSGRPVCEEYNTGAKIFHLMPCQEEHLECNITDDRGNPECISKKYVTIITYPGESCFSNAHCHTSNCINGICKGADLDEFCVSNGDCDAGYICQGGSRCARAQEKGQLCGGSLACASYLHCVNRTCMEYGAVDNDAYFSIHSTEWVEAANFLCKSGKSETVKIGGVAGENESLFKCVAGERLKVKEGDVCTYENVVDGTTHTEEAKCALSPDGDKFCPKKNQDNAFIETFNNLCNYLREKKPYCSSVYKEFDASMTLLEPASNVLVRKFFCNNIKEYAQFDELKKEFFERLFETNSHILAKYDSCMEAILTSVYFKTKSVASLSTHRFSCILSLLIPLLLLFI